MEELIKTLRVGNVFCLLHVGNMPDDKVRHSTKLFAEKVMPHLRNLWPDWQNHDDRFWCHPMHEPVPHAGWLPNEVEVPARSSICGTRIEVVEAGKGRDLLFLHGAGGHMPTIRCWPRWPPSTASWRRCCRATAGRAARTGCATCSTSRCMRSTCWRS